MGAEVLEKRAEGPVRVAVRREPRFAAQAPADGPQGEQGLVRGALSAGTPHLERFELGEELLGVRDVHDRIWWWDSSVVGGPRAGLRGLSWRNQSGN